jgi:hypothetical protein
MGIGGPSSSWNLSTRKDGERLKEADSVWGGGGPHAAAYFTRNTERLID